MSILLHTLIPVFGLMALGFLAVRVGLVDAGGARGLVLFAFNFSIPALLLTSMARLELPGAIEWDFAVAFYAASFLVYGLGAALGRAFFARPLRDQAIFGMGAAFSNLVLIGIPVVVTAFGPEATLPMMVIIGLHSATFMPLTVLLIEADAGQESRVSERIRRVLTGVVTNPIILGIVVGLALNLADASPWSVVQAILDLLGAAAVPVALFAVGASLAGLSAGGDAPEALALTFGKLVVHPLLVWLIAVPVMGSDGLAVSVAVVLAAMPSAVNVYLFGAHYQAAAGVAARTVFLSTVGALFTLTAVLLILGAGGG